LSWTLPIGANIDGEGVRFRVWAPAASTLEVVVQPGAAEERAHGLRAEADGWWSGRVDGVGAGVRYRYRVDGGEAYPDPASRWQPEGVHGPSVVVDPAAFQWRDQGWRGRPLEQLVIYELHVGTATAAGTFDALIERLDDLVALGVTAIEPLPIAQFPGDRNWGYDGVQLFAPAAAYGGPEGFRRLVDAAHARGLAVILDVVYNHLGPEGNYLHPLTGGRFFTARHQTPWGDGIAYETAAVRELIIANALFWAHEYHVDGLRLDATHAIQDDSPQHVVRELAARVRASLPADRHFVFIAEDERNERRVVLPAEQGGWGLDAVWADDFHHQVRVMTAGDRHAYYASFSGSAEDLAETLRRGWFFSGQTSPATGASRGTPGDDLPPAAFVHCVQNHDQVGNRALGDRLHHRIDPARYRAAVALLLLSPYTPLLWMGQEWAASAPFLYFTDHPEALGRLVTEGRRREVHQHESVPMDQVPDPQARSTFLSSKLDWAERSRQPHAGVLELHRELLALRATLWDRGRGSFRALALGDRVVALQRADLLVVASFADSARVDLGPWEIAAYARSLVLATEEARFGGGEGPVASLNGSTLELPRPGALVLRS
jgi:maltooligosyltrehalose trehalohydrolase